jgi:hypothetical protein
MGSAIQVFEARADADLEPAFARMDNSGVGALLVADDPLFRARRVQLVALARACAMPTMYFGRDFAAIGGLVSYGSSSRDNWRKAATYVGRLLNGAQPADLPILQPSLLAAAARRSCGSRIVYCDVSPGTAITATATSKPRLPSAATPAKAARPTGERYPHAGRR